MKRFEFRWLVIAILFAAMALLPAGRAHADGTVENCSDDSAFNSVVLSGGLVTFDCGVQTIALSSTKTITVNTTIDGGGKITLDGGHARRLFIVNHGVSLDLKNIVLTNGYDSSSNGGTIVNNGFLAMEHSTIQNAGNSNFYGGAIFTTGNADISDSKFINDKAGSGGAIYASGSGIVVNISGSELYNNSVSSSNPNANRGGAMVVADSATVDVLDSSLHNNTGDYGGAIANEASTLTLTNDMFANNKSNAQNGGALSSTGTMTLSHVTLSNNTASVYGGGIVNVGTATLTNVTLLNNQAGIGGGIFNAATLIMSHSTLTGNKELGGSNGGGGLDNNGASANATLTFDTFNQNTANGGGAGIENALGATATITNVTLSGNTAGNSSGVGGGLYNFNSTATLTNVTFSDNSAPASSTSGGGITNINDVNHHLYLKNVILSNSVAGGNCSFHNAPDTSVSNLSSDATCNFGAGRDSVNLKLGKLETNGGDTSTHRLLPGSPAIDAGTNTGCPGTDQRGITRIQGNACDAGAVEFIPCVSAPQKATLLSPVANAQVTTQQVLLDWGGPDCVKQYSVVVRRKSPSGSVVYSKSKLKLSQATTPTLAHKQKYVWQVSACNGTHCTTGDWFKFKVK